jgi:hypothetical protein
VRLANPGYDIDGDSYAMGDDEAKGKGGQTCPNRC